MTNPLSVLLIIGSAVVGPIESRVERAYCAKRPIEAPGYACGEWWGDLSYQILDYTEETLAQLCERAMREAGATMGAHYSVGFMPDQSQNGLDGRDSRVRCIPTPSGYRK